MFLLKRPVFVVVKGKECSVIHNDEVKWMNLHQHFKVMIVFYSKISRSS